jgi:hypothetical protein
MKNLHNIKASENNEAEKSFLQNSEIIKICHIYSLTKKHDCWKLSEI